MLGRNPGPIPRGKSIYDLALPSVPAGVPSALLERRPDLLQSEQSLIAANAQIGAARALYFPTISLTGAFGGASADLSNLFSGPARAWNYTGQIVGPIFTFGAVSGQVAQAEAAQQAALFNYQLSIQNAFADVDNALVANQKLKDQLAAQERLVAALKDYARLARLQYDGGYAPYSTVLQAEQSLFPAELTLAAVRASVFIVGRQHVQGDGRRLGHRRRPADRERRHRHRRARQATARVLTRLRRRARARRRYFGSSVAARSRARSARIADSAAFQARASASGVASATGARCRYSRDQITFGASAFAGER